MNSQPESLITHNVQRRFIHPAAREGDQAACAHKTRAQPPPFRRGAGYHIVQYSRVKRCKIEM